MDSAKLFLSSFGDGGGGGNDPGDPIGQSLRIKNDSQLSKSNSEWPGNFSATGTLSVWYKFALWTENQSDIWWVCPNIGDGGFFDRGMAHNGQTGVITVRGNTGISTVPGVYRDPGAWYHIVMCADGTNQKVYVNGELKLTTTNTWVGGAAQIGTDKWQWLTPTDSPGGNMAAVYFVDGQDLGPTVFGRYNEFGVWVPVKPEGLTFGPNGFHLDFSDPNDIGADRSPNGNNFTATGFDFTYPGLFSENQYASPAGSYVADPAARTEQLTSPEQTFDGNLYSQVQVGNTADPNTFGGWYYWQANLTNVTSLYFGNNSSAIATEVRINGVSVPFTTGNSGPTNVFGDNWIHPEIPEDGIVNEIAFISAGASTNTQCNGFLLNGNTEANLLVDNISGTYDSMLDSPTQNYATGNPLVTPYGTTNPVTLTDSNLGKIQNVSPCGNGLGPTIHWDEDAHIFFEIRVNGNPFPFNTFFAFIADPGPNVEYSTLGISNRGFLVWSGSAAFGTNGSLTKGGILSGVTFDQDVTMPPDSVWGWEWDGPNQRIRYYANGELLATSSQWTAGDFKNVAFYFDFNAQPASPYTANYGQQPFIFKPEGAQGILTESQYEPTIQNGRDHFQAITGAGTGYLVYNEGTSSNPDPQQAAILTDLVGATPTGAFMTSSVIYDMGAPVTYASPGFQATAGYWVTAGAGYQPITTLVSLDGSANSWTQVDEGTYIDQSEDKFININTSTPFRYVRMRKDTQNNNLALAGPGAGGILEAAQNAFPNGLWWIKDRANTNQHQLVDSIRGQVGGNWQAKTSPGNGPQGDYVAPAGSSVAWCWNAPDAYEGDGGLAPQGAGNGFRNPAAGFSMLGYTGNADATQTVQHNLGMPLAFVFATSVTENKGYPVWCKGMADDQDLALDAPREARTADNIVGNRTNTLHIDVGGQYNTDGEDYVMYAWGEVPGYSSFGSYQGNGNDQGIFVYCGFTPAFIMYKRTSTTGNWVIHDTTRNTINPATLRLVSNTADSEGTATTMAVDIVSNGFKHRNSDNDLNADSHTYVYCAFAENPFQSPVTAR